MLMDDDVIATLVREAPDDLEVSIVSSDKDLMQLVSDRVSLLDGIKDRRYGPADVEARFGVPPDKILDVRSLIGDPSDNIPGDHLIRTNGAGAASNHWHLTISVISDRKPFLQKKLIAMPRSHRATFSTPFGHS